MITTVYMTKPTGEAECKVFNHSNKHEMMESLYMIHGVVNGEYHGVKITMQTVKV